MAKQIRPSRVLEQIAAVVLEQPRHHDVAAFHQPHAGRRVLPARRRSARATPKAPRHSTSTRARSSTPSGSVRCPERRRRHRAASQRVRVRMSAPRSAASRAVSTTRRASSTQQSEYSKARRDTRAAAARPAGSCRRSSTRVGGRIRAAAQMVVEEQSRPDHPPRPQPGMVRQHEAQRPDDVRRGAQQHFALRQRFPHQAELVILQIAQAAMDQLGGGGGRGPRPDHPVPPAAPTGRAPRHRAQCRRR